MDYIFQAGLILLLELNIFYLFGCIIENLKIFPKEQNVSGRFICGFIGYHFIFWCISFPQTMMNGSLDFLTITWTIVLIIILLASLMVYHRNIFKAYSEVVQMCWKYKLYIIPCILLHVFLVYYVCVNGQNDVDARNYIGQVTVMLDTNKLVGVLTATGAIMDEILFKRAFSMLGANSAVMCNIFSMHPLVYCRTVRAAVNIIVLAVATFSVLKWVYKNKEDVVEHSIMVVMFANTFLFLFCCFMMSCPPDSPHLYSLFSHSIP